MESLTLCPITNGNGNNNSNGSEEHNCTAATSDQQGHVPFTYDRGAASQAASQLSTQLPTSVSAVPALPHYSAYFMSLALRAGRLPLTNPGWNASWSGTKLEGNSVWNAHSFSNPNAPQSDGALVGYISGALAAGLPAANQRSFQYTSGENFTSLPVSTLVDVTNGAFHLDALATLPSALTTYEPGDYVYLDSRQGGVYVTHGLMMVGNGKPIKCANSALDDVVFRSCHNQSPCVDTIDNSKNAAGDILNDSVRVPYVADWNNGLQTQTPRPFYCTASRGAQTPSGTSNNWFDHTIWLFIRAPSSGWVQQGVYVAPSARVSAQGAIQKCH